MLGQQVPCHESCCWARGQMLDLAVLGAAAEVLVVASPIDLLAEGARTSDVVDRLLLALPLGVEKDHEDSGDDEGGEFCGAPTIEGQLHGAGALRSRNNSSGKSCRPSNLLCTRKSLRRGHESNPCKFPESDGREQSDKKPPPM